MATKKVYRKPDYHDGKIYMLYDNTNSAIYVGSTTRGIATRMDRHKKDYKYWRDGYLGYEYSSSFDIIANGNCIIVLIEDFPCNSKVELQEREQYWIDYHEGCINKFRAHSTPEQKKEINKQYRTDHADELKEKNKIWRTDNVEVLKEKQKIFRTENADVIRERKRAFRVANDAKIKEHKNKKATCECGVEYSHANLARHLRSAQHTKLLTILKSPVIL
jgi:hypothetical protein